MPRRYAMPLGIFQQKRIKKQKMKQTKKEVKYMENLKEEIAETLEKLEVLIKSEEKTKIEEQRKILDKMLEKYLKDMQK